MRKPYLTSRYARPAMALIAVLWIAALMTALVSVAAQTSLLDSRVSQIENEKHRTRWACRGGVETAIALLLEDDRAYDSLIDIWADNPLELEALDFDGAQVTVQVVDAASKLNVNTASRNQLLALPDMTEDIADSILDWIDSDDDVRTGGAESGYYLSLDFGYEARNGRMRTIRELLRVKGVTEDLFYGHAEQHLLAADNEGWIHYLTCVSRQVNQDADGNARININRADERTLMRELDLTEGQARWIVENRQFDSLGDLIGQAVPADRQRPGPAQNQPPRQDPRQNQTDNRNPNNNNNNNNEDDRPAVEPLDVKTVLERADRITLSRRRTIWGQVNINTADLQVLTALFEGNRELALETIAARQTLGGAFVDFSDLLHIEALTQDILRRYLDQMTIRSDIFEIHATAVSQATELTWSVEAIVNRQAQQGQVAYWREGISR